MSKFFYFFLVVVFIFIGCQPKQFDSKPALLSFLKDEKNGFIFHKESGGVNYSLLYKPTDLLVSQELDSVSQEEVNKLRKKYSQYMYFNLSLSKNGKELLSSAAGSRKNFNTLVQQLVFEMDQKVLVYTSENDTLPLHDYIYPRMYGMGSSTSILFVYPRKEKYLNSEALFFKIKDFGLQTGNVKFKIPIEIIKNEPSIKF